MTPNAITWLIVAFVLVAAVNAWLPPRGRVALLITASLVFYVAIGSVIELLQLVLASGFGFGIARAMSNTADVRARKRLVTLGVLVLVANLFFFKYALFMSENLRALLARLEVGWQVPLVQVLLPLGISFYTFQLIAYLVDVHRGLPAERDPGVFLLSVSFFPKLIAGPIERAGDLLPQLSRLAAIDRTAVIEGTCRIVWGAFKKLVVADSLGIFVDAVFDDPRAFGGPASVVVTALYAFQIFFDFSGYADMAIGAARILGVRLSINFDRPYCAISIQDFWKRWHRTLSSWLTDYVYGPLLRQRVLRFKLYYMMLASILITFLVSGLWHGAQWHFICWGLLHGCYMAGAVILQKPWAEFSERCGLTRRPALERMLNIGFTFSLVCVGYVFFRAGSLADALYMLRHMPTGWLSPNATLADLFRSNAAAGVTGLLGTAAILWQEARPSSGAMRAILIAVCAAAVIATCAIHGAPRAFIYYRF